jgi:hypothetical protein
MVQQLYSVRLFVRQYVVKKKEGIEKGDRQPRKDYKQKGKCSFM